ncbi:hypothetical protein DYU05_20465 [Mucilaginibacter terrenus]|uniref:Glycoside hydrolase family 2 catalytic domain-containing protein n=1 Tax=Mucilaginibacter terrenus TaxID=2482727 RepID=A0A3E2NJF7_9SPHI|nr:glycoside hydrolase family 2 TIM barrel-domain containing protein [Mucilaginibacter terrenus]RFZ81136.1 hypothetical protein DYU05_20465 [Mucilaginibacter terrenus]
MIKTFTQPFIFRLSTLIVVFAVIVSCNNNSTGTRNRTVYIKKENSKYTMYRYGKPFFVKGASGFTNLKALYESGGNTIRTWDTANLKPILDSAQANHLAVVVGLPLPPSDDISGFYGDGAKVKANLLALTKFVNRYKNHPAVLAWCLGNELAFPLKPNYNAFYTTFGDLVNTFHRIDPNHPVTTTVMSFQKKNLTNIKLRTNIDFVSFNIFGAIATLKKDLDDFNWFWDGPFLITEWGVEGPWVYQSQNIWGSYVEDASSKKAEQYMSIYKNYMPANNSRFLGSMVFYWGQKQEFTPTWFSMFDELGYKTEAVNVMQNIWTGKKATAHAPDIKFTLVNYKGAHDNILLKTNTEYPAAVYINGTNNGHLSYKWKLYKEDWFKPNRTFREDKPIEITNSIQGSGDEIRFTTPSKEGPYRLFVYVYNEHGYVATSNTPFYVLTNP